MAVRLHKNHLSPRAANYSSHEYNMRQLYIDIIK
jgi:hypothetical protein